MKDLIKFQGMQVNGMMIDECIIQSMTMTTFFFFLQFSQDRNSPSILHTPEQVSRNASQDRNSPSSLQLHTPEQVSRNASQDRNFPS
jgi:hypothetical protein